MIQDDPLALLGREVSSAGALSSTDTVPKLAIADMEKPPPNMDDMDQKYVRLQRSIKLAKQSLNLIPAETAQCNRGNTSIQDLRSSMESSAKVLHDVGFMLDFHKTPDNGKLTTSSIDNKIKILDDMITQVLADVRCVRTVCIPKKQKQGKE